MANQEGNNLKRISSTPQPEEKPRKSKKCYPGSERANEKTHRPEQKTPPKEATGKNSDRTTERKVKALNSAIASINTAIKLWYSVNTTNEDTTKTKTEIPKNADLTEVRAEVIQTLKIAVRK